ncbi:AAA family ATPase [Streptomyces rhizosphaericus]|uniref:Chromosome partition protein Smc n=1 Tax=Streptomyces rhizosphaericus TaxID=114699 RepID=A0A6G4AKI3_9ACTN|nr:AAA family ATPase [Streptomyces rhizosphaericus]NEW73956.1 AAA family ATPase [Streptomyces rhizosphaericus]
MHLKSLTLRGFKSFASATTLRFEPGITCVVGPNGSGKSNVVDALSWVMGEQGAKSLRGGKMEDVIFAGTTGRPPLGRAEVSLTIDNADGALPIDYAEVTITRIMFRNGGSEYQLNGDTCRLLDIQELLSDSGIGREMHVIVGQGQLDGVLHADPTGRRAFIEEAAGVLKHRKRKEKALRKLDAMQANLARVQDLTDELRRQLKPLGRQAAVARRAAVIQADLRDARLRLLADDLVTLREALRAEVADEAELKRRKEAAEAELRAAQQREAALEEQVRRLAPRLRDAQQTWYELSQLAERVRGTISLADARVKSATSAPGEERRGRDPEDMEREAARVREQEAELEAALEAASRALDDTVAHRAELERSLAEEERRLKDVARAIADRREGLARLQGQVNAARGRAGSARAEIERLAASRDEAQTRAVAAQEEYEQLKAEVDGLDADDAELAERHEAAKRELAEAEAALSAAREAATAAERERAATSARHDALALGLRRKDGTGALMAAADRLGGLLGPAAELLTVTPGFEVPVATALGAAADAIAVSGPHAAAAAIRLLRADDAGRATLLLTTPTAEEEPPPAALAESLSAHLAESPSAALAESPSAAPEPGGPGAPAPGGAALVPGTRAEGAARSEPDQGPAPRSATTPEAPGPLGRPTEPGTTASTDAETPTAGAGSLDGAPEGPGETADGAAAVPGTRVPGAESGGRDALTAGAGSPDGAPGGSTETADSAAAVPGTRSPDGPVNESSGSDEGSRPGGASDPGGPGAPQAVADAVGAAPETADGAAAVPGTRSPDGPVNESSGSDDGSRPGGADSWGTASGSAQAVTDAAGASSEAEGSAAPGTRAPGADAVSRGDSGAASASAGPGDDRPVVPGTRPEASGDEGRDPRTASDGAPAASVPGATVPGAAVAAVAGPAGSVVSARVPQPAGGEAAVAGAVPGGGSGGTAAVVEALPWVADLVAGPAALLPAVRRLLDGMVVVGTLEEAEELLARRPELTAVTAEGDLLGAHFAQGGSAGAPTLLEVQASVDEAAAELERLAVRCEELAGAQRAAQERRAECLALVEELAGRRSAADREKSRVAQSLGRLAGQARGAAGEAERSTAAVARAEEALERATEEAEELAEQLAVAEEEPGEEEPDTSVRDRLAADGANARQTEMEARLQVRTHEERVKGLAGRADALDRGARAEREARTRAEQRRARLRHEAEVASAVASGARQLLAHVEVSLVRAEQERDAAERAKAERERELDAARGQGRDLKGELDKLTDSVHRGEVLGAEKRMRIEQLETKALEELGVEPAGLIAEYGPDQLVPPSPPAEGEVLPEDPEHPRNQPVRYVRAQQEKRLKAAERAYQQLGKVNPLALEEFAALEERHQFLSEQLEDLKKTRADLLQVVKEVDERVEQVFTEAYRDTAREFEGVFSRLFPGGEGRLVLTDPENMLTTGVDVEARPPGKKVKRLSLLSGGERSLTAVALLVSIFKARPSPFYVMDEVEAALDDTNLQRLIRIMQELQEASQLIVITHQKRTMEVADALYGVSMQGDGVSKVISQRLR